MGQRRPQKVIDGGPGVFSSAGSTSTSSHPQIEHRLWSTRNGWPVLSFQSSTSGRMLGTCRIKFRSPGARWRIGRVAHN